MFQAGMRTQMVNSHKLIVVLNTNWEIATNNKRQSPDT
jgi:hypothetical protein